jgi:peptide/nickel transport system permease protein
MIQFFLKKLIFLIPTVLVVIITAFFLSKLVPGDRAESILILQGVQPEASNYQKEYQRVYLQQGLDKPLFYFSVLPHFYPENINRILDPQERQLWQKWLQEKYPSENISKVLDERRNLVTLLEKNTSYQNNDILKNIRFESDVQKLNNITDKLLGFQPSSKKEIKTFQSKITELEASKISWYYPRVAWHGYNNQFHFWVASVLKGDFGQSIKDGRPVSEKVGKAIQWTLILALLSISVALIISIPVGLYSGYYNHTWITKVSDFFWLILYSVPVFWLASILILYTTSGRYGSWLDIFPAPGLWYIPEGQSTWKTLSQYGQQLILPVVCMVANDIAQISAIIRNNTEEQKSKPYIMMARAKGLNDNGILRKHILPNVLLPLITIGGGRLASALSGALIIEVIFNIPGMGRLMYDSILAGDWNVVFGILVVLSVVTVIVLAVTDIMYAWANPKIEQKMQVS